MYNDRPILLYDGECGVCSRFVDFVLKHEQDDSILFAALESEVGMDLRSVRGIRQDIDSVILILGDTALTHSDAVLVVLGMMKSPWKHLQALRIFPKSLRDWAYRTFAANRSLFGTNTSCRLVTPAERPRFLDLASASSAVPVEDQSIA